MFSLDQICIYPIKSCAGIDLQSSRVLDRGFPLDRRWLLVDDKGQFISQRSTPLLSQIKLSHEKDQITVSYPDRTPLCLDVNHHSGIHHKVKIWKDSVEALWVSQDCDDWFSAVLGQPVHLIHMNDEVHRPVFKEGLPQDRSYDVSFADAYPYLLTSQSSLDDLNGRLKRPIPMDRFRANLVVSGFEAFAEDHWKRIKIGPVEFLVIKPCARCQITTIDQRTGVISKEPLKTLAGYRKQNGKVMFGMNLLALGSATVSLKDRVSIIE